MISFDKFFDLVPKFKNYTRPSGRVFLYLITFTATFFSVGATHTLNTFFLLAVQIINHTCGNSRYY